MCSKVIGLSEVCRACLIKRQNMKTLLSHNDELVRKFSSLLHSEIQMNNGYPHFLCSECEEKLDISFKFQLLCQQSHQFILSCSDKTVSVDGTDTIKSEKCNEVYQSNESKVQIYSAACSDITKPVDFNDEDSIKSERDNEMSCFNETRDEDFADSGGEVFTDNEESKQITKLAQYPQEEVDAVIKSIREKQVKQQECLFCTFTARGTRSLTLHMSRLHKEHRQKWCFKCNATVTNLSDHKKNEHGDDLKCNFCGKISGNTSHLLEHLASHIVGRKYECDICEKSFMSSRHLKVHSKIHYPKKKKQKKSSANENDANIESNTEGNKEDAEKKALCVYCGKKFKSSRLVVHIRIHTGETPYKCSYCEARMTTRTRLVVHERTHTGEKPYVCDICGKGFAQSCVLATHKKIHTGRTEHCSLCPKKFCRPSELKQHMRKHTGEKPFLCEFCNKAFVQKSHLAEHLWTHTDERRFKCEFCEKSFRQAGTLKSHMKIHAG